MTKKDILRTTSPASLSVGKYSCKNTLTSPVVQRTPLIQYLARIYENLLGHPVTNRYAFRILHAQVSLLMLLFPFSLNFIVRVLLLLWFVVALLQCHRD